jgi:hypothetical protein
LGWIKPVKTVLPPKNHCVGIALNECQTYDTKYLWTWLYTPIGGLNFSTYHKAMFFFSNIPTHLPEEPIFAPQALKNIEKTLT